MATVELVNDLLWAITPGPVVVGGFMLRITLPHRGNEVNRYAFSKNRASFERATIDPDSGI